jgi:hypothetical protein
LRCGGFGHKVAQCPTSQELGEAQSSTIGGTNSWSSTWKGKGKGNAEQSECFACGKKGHWARESWTCKGNSKGGKPKGENKGKGKFGKPDGEDVPAAEIDTRIYSVDSVVRRASALQRTPAALADSSESSS